MNKIKASIVVPIFNEELNIKFLVNEIINCKVYEVVNEILFVNDCSTDGSLKILNTLKKTYKKIKIINHSQNLGQSACLLTGVKNTSEELVITIDGDCQNNPNDINKLLTIFLSNPDTDLVAGIRKKRKDNLVKIYTSKFANFLRMKILKDDCVDTGCSLKIFKKKIFLSFPFFDGIHRFLPALFKGYEKKILFIDVDHRNRLHGISKYGTFGRMFRGIRDIIKVLKIIKNYKKNNV